MTLLNDEPTQPTMREQIEGLIVELEKKRDSIYKFIDNSQQYEVDIKPLWPQARILEDSIDRLRAILDSEN